MKRSRDIPLFEEIRQYNNAINITPPRYGAVDIRRFEENMPAVRSVMPPFRNSFYQVALVMDAGGYVGQNYLIHDFKECTLFYNTPGQILKWDIVKDWKGYYVSFKPDFVSLSMTNSATLNHYPFFRHGAKKFFDLDKGEALALCELFEKIYYEYSHPAIYSRAIIQSYLKVILNYGTRFYRRQNASRYTRDDLQPLVQQFEDFLDEMFRPVSLGLDVQLKSISGIAGELNVSPKYLSEVLKEETGRTALEHVHKRILDLAMGLLKNTSLRVSEIAYQLGFEHPPYFSRLFKKHIGQSPSAYRNSQ